MTKTEAQANSNRIKSKIHYLKKGDALPDLLLQNVENLSPETFEIERQAFDT
jgi:hypothetical protein